MAKVQPLYRARSIALREYPFLSNPTRSFPRRHFQHSSKPSASFAFAFDIDGVLCRSNGALPGASSALKLLHANNIPFILLTNGGGKTEQARVDQLSRILGTTISSSNFVQSHTPFESFTHLKNSTALILGGPQDGHSCRLVAEGYGFQSVVTPLDLFAAHPEIWPFGVSSMVKEHIRPLNRPLAPSGLSQEKLDSTQHLKIDAALVFNDPRDWGLDCSVLLDTLLSHQGYIGSLSPQNGRRDLPNAGYLQDGQPKIYFSNPDVFWAAKWPHPRLGQGAFRAAFEGVWKAATNGADLLNVEQWGKPTGSTYKFAEKKLNTLREESALAPFKTVYMVGDNPASDIQGANNFKSTQGTKWRSILVRSGVYTDGKPAHKPDITVEGVWDAVESAFIEEGFSINPDSRG